LERLRFGGSVAVALHVVQVILAIFLIVLILFQSKGAGLGSIFGGTDSVFTTRRGIERTLFNFTVGTAAAFLVFSLLVVMILRFSP
jgi:preprotein translocase subunit SecG